MHHILKVFFVFSSGLSFACCHFTIEVVVYYKLNTTYLPRLIIVVADLRGTSLLVYLWVPQYLNTKLIVLCGYTPNL